MAAGDVAVALAGVAVVVADSKSGVEGMATPMTMKHCHCYYSCRYCLFRVVAAVCTDDTQCLMAIRRMAEAYQVGAYHTCGNAACTAQASSAVVVVTPAADVPRGGTEDILARVWLLMGHRSRG